MAYKLKYGQKTDFQEGDRVRIVVRSELYKRPDETELSYTGRITQIDDDGFWAALDGDPDHREEYFSFLDIENVLVKG